MKATCRLFLFLSFFFSFWSLAVFISPAEAASFLLSPDKAEVKKGEKFSVAISLDTAGADINGVQATLAYDKEKLSLDKIDFSSLFPSNFQTSDVNKGKIQVGSGENSPVSFVFGKHNWVTLTFLAANLGEGKVSFSCFDSAILELGTADNLLDCLSLNQGNYLVFQQAAPPTPTPPESPPISPPSPPGPACTENSPSAPSNFKAATGLNEGEVVLSWAKSSGATHYSVVFGVTSQKYLYGAANIGDVNMFTVRSLTPGRLYYFAVSAVKSCAASGFSSEVSARAKKQSGAATPGATVSKRALTPSPPPGFRPIKDILWQTVEETAPPSYLATPTPIPALSPSLIERFWRFFFSPLFLVLAFSGILLVCLVALWRILRKSP